MSDWSQIILCPVCGSGNPHDALFCIDCGIDLLKARAREQADREERLADLRKQYRPIGSLNDKPINELTIRDLKRRPVWEFDLANEGKPGRDETWVKPVKKLPVTDLSCCVVGTHAQLANGHIIFCMLDNISLDSQSKTDEFVCLTVLNEDGDDFILSRYFDSDYERNGPEGLARFLGLPIEDVFPISYDISAIAKGVDRVIKGTIPREPAKRLTDEERRQLIFM